jgi:hypothetical protein
MRRQSARLALVGSTLACILCPACQHAPNTVVAVSVPTWYEDGASAYAVSPDGQWALLAGRSGTALANLATQRVDTIVAGAAGRAALRARLGPVEPAWSALQPRPPAVPEGAVLERSPDGHRLAFFPPDQDTVFVGPADTLQPYVLDGTVTGMGWVPHGDLLYVLVLHPDGLSALDRINVETGAVQPIRQQLDAPPRGGSVAVSADAGTLYLALASDTIPAPAARHRPDADRDTDIYALDLKSARLSRVAATPGDDISPVIAGNVLYWTQNDYADQVAIIPAAGGPTRAVIDAGMLPYWSADGAELAYTNAGYRLADWGLDLDAFAVSVNDSGRPTSAPRPIAAGYHEDFTPTWSPDGAWIAYHSHRPPTPVPLYDSPGHTDDIYLRRPGAPMSQEIRLTDWGWETGVANWAPDGRHLVFDTWDRGGTPGIAHPWIVTIDTARGRLVARRRLPLPPGVGGTRFASWSPSGDTIAFVAQEQPGRQSLWVTSLDGRRARKLAAFANWTYGGLDWTPDARSIVFGALAPDGRRLALFRIPAAGGTPALLTHDSASVLQPQVSPDGRWIAATRFIHRKVLWRLRQ